MFAYETIHFRFPIEQKRPFKPQATNIRKLTGVTATLLLMGVFGQTSFSQEPGRASEPNRLGLIQRSTSLIGKKVVDRNERVIGRLEDLLLDISNGSVSVTLVSSATKRQLTPVPAET